MVHNKKIAIVMPAYNAALTLKKVLNDIPHDIVDFLILVDDASKDNTVEVAKKLKIKHVISRPVNGGYGANQKTCYDKALELGADIIVMLHPDYQYTPLLITPMVYVIANNIYPVVFGSRILGKGALRGGMPFYKYIFNRFLTLFQNILTNNKLSEYHTGYRAFSAEVLRAVDYKKNSDDFVFDNQIIAQIFDKDFEIGEITCPTKYFDEASSINFKRSLKYGFGVLSVSIQYRLHKWGLFKYKILT